MSIMSSKYAFVCFGKVGKQPGKKTHGEELELEKKVVLE